MTQTNSTEKKEARIIKALNALDGFAACNINEPSEGDLKRIYLAYQKAWSDLAHWRDLAFKLAAVLEVSIRHTMVPHQITHDELICACNENVIDCQKALVEFSKLSGGEK